MLMLYFRAPPPESEALPDMRKWFGSAFLEEKFSVRISCFVLHAEPALIDIAPRLQLGTMKESCR